MDESVMRLLDRSADKLSEKAAQWPDYVRANAADQDVPLDESRALRHAQTTPQRKQMEPRRKLLTPVFPVHSSSVLESV